MDLPDLLGRFADLVAQRYIRRQVARELGCAESTIDWGMRRAGVALRKLEWPARGPHLLDDVVEVISLKREGKVIRNVGCLAKTFPSRGLTEEEAGKIIRYLCTVDFVERGSQRSELEVLINRLMADSFARRKALFAQVQELRRGLEAAGVQWTQFPPEEQNDPEWLQFQLDIKEPFDVPNTPPPVRTSSSKIRRADRPQRRG